MSANLRRYVIPAAALVLWAGSAHGDAGLPMILVTWPTMVLALVPTILVEAFILAKVLARPVRRLVGPATTANAASTLLGTPLVWLLLVAVEVVTGGSYAYGTETPLQRILAVTWQAPWLIPYHEHLRWMVPAAGLVLLVPFFFASWLIEYWITKRMLRDIEPRTIRRAVLVANLASYGGLATIAVFILITATL